MTHTSLMFSRQQKDIISQKVIFLFNNIIRIFIVINYEI